MTRLGGRRVVLGKIRTGFGPRLWAGEYRDNQDRPLGSREVAGPGLHFSHELRVAPGTVAGLAGLLTTLSHTHGQIKGIS